MVNVIALALRTPMIYLMTSLMGIYYVISNLVSLAVLTVLRFLVADNCNLGPGFCQFRHLKNLT